MDNVRPPLLWRHKFAYSLGHFYNDLCSAMWFTYLLIYFTYVLGISNAFAGYALLLGQVVDAICTPLIGYESDRVNGFCGYTKRKSWHLIGTIFVTFSFPFLFLPCLEGNFSQNWVKLLYYTPFISAFQFGWASTQIAHMTLVSELTYNESERVELNSYRNASTLLSNVIVYSIGWALFDQSSNNQFNPEDWIHFIILMSCVIGLGLATSILFHLFTPEHGQNIVTTNFSQSLRWRDWLQEYQFYLIGLLYMLVRLLNNISQTFWPLYVTDTLVMDKKYTSIIPMVIFISGFIASLTMKKVNNILGRKPTFILGSLLTIGGLVWMKFLQPASSFQVFGAAILFGCGSTTLLVTVLTMIADLIGIHTSSSAFVYGVMSFGDKLSSGIALMIIQQLRPSNLYEKPLAEYIANVIVYVVGTITLMSLILVLFMWPITIGSLTKIIAPIVPEPEGEVDERTPILNA